MNKLIINLFGIFILVHLSFNSFCQKDTIISLSKNISYRFFSSPSIAVQENKVSYECMTKDFDFNILIQDFSDTTNSSAISDSLIEKLDESLISNVIANELIHRNQGSLFDFSISGKEILIDGKQKAVLIEQKSMSLISFYKNGKQFIIGARMRENGDLSTKEIIQRFIIRE